MLDALYQERIYRSLFDAPAVTTVWFVYRSDDQAGWSESLANVFTDESAARSYAGSIWGGRVVEGKAYGTVEAAQAADKARNK